MSRLLPIASAAEQRIASAAAHSSGCNSSQRLQREVAQSSLRAATGKTTGKPLCIMRRYHYWRLPCSAKTNLKMAKEARRGSLRDAALVFSPRVSDAAQAGRNGQCPSGFMMESQLYARASYPMQHL